MCKQCDKLLTLENLVMYVYTIYNLYAIGNKTLMQEVIGLGLSVLVAGGGGGGGRGGAGREMGARGASTFGRSFAIHANEDIICDFLSVFFFPPTTC